jgi:hypothetical protein
MLKKLLMLTLVGLLVNLVAFVPVRAATREEKEARFAEKVREGIKRLGTGESARIELKLRDKTKLKGYVSALDDESFSVTDAAGATTVVAYAHVKQAKGNNLSTGQKVMIGVGIALVVLLVVAIVVVHDASN